MMRKFTHYVLLSAMWCGVLGCQDDEISSPPKPSPLQADKTSAEVGEAVTFTIKQINADAVSLLPYGLPGGDAGQLVTFTDGVATVEFKYERPGTFDAIVVANNHTGDGESVKNVQSDPLTITITSSKNSITEFSFADIETETTIDQDARTIDVEVPYGTDVSTLKATFTASGFSKVTIGGTEQVSGTTVNDFATPKTYTVTANNGTAVDYTVAVSVAPVETTNTIKTITATAVSTNSDEKALQASVDNVNRIIVIYDTLGTAAAQFDSVRVGYELDGDFGLLKYGGKVMDQDSLLDLTTMQEFEVYSQDSTNAGGIQSYAVYAVDAPKLALSFPDLNPDAAEGVEPTNFNFEINTLKGTDRSSIKTTTSFSGPATSTISDMKVDGIPFNDGDAVDYSKPVELEFLVTDSNLGISYTVMYTVTVKAIP